MSTVPLPNPAVAKPQNGAAAVSFNILFAQEAAATAASQRLKALTPLDYSFINATLTSAVAGLPGAPLGFSLVLPPSTITVAAMTYRRWALLLDWLKRNIAKVLGGTLALIFTLMCLCGARSLRAARTSRRRAAQRIAAKETRSRSRSNIRRAVVRAKALGALRRWARPIVAVTQSWKRAMLNPSDRSLAATAAAAAALAAATASPPAAPVWLDGGAPSASPPKLRAPASSAPLPVIHEDGGAPSPRGPRGSPPSDSAAQFAHPPVRRSPPPAHPSPHLSPIASPLPQRALAVLPSPPRGSPSRLTPQQHHHHTRPLPAAPGSRLDDGAPLTGARLPGAPTSPSPYAAPLGLLALPHLPGAVHQHLYDPPPSSARGLPLSPSALQQLAVGAGASAARPGARLPLSPRRRAGSDSDSGASMDSGRSSDLGGDSFGGGRDAQSPTSVGSALDARGDAHRSVMLNFQSNSPVPDAEQASVGLASPRDAVSARNGGGSSARAPARPAGSGLVVTRQPSSRLPTLRAGAVSRGSSVGSAHTNYASRAGSRGTLGRAAASSLTPLQADLAGLAAASRANALLATATAQKSQAGAKAARSARTLSPVEAGGGRGGFAVAAAGSAAGAATEPAASAPPSAGASEQGWDV